MLIVAYGARLSSFVDVNGNDMAIADADANQRNRDRLEPGAPSAKTQRPWRCQAVWNGVASVCAMC